jgi:hypothetical protein
MPIFLSISSYQCNSYSSPSVRNPRIVQSEIPIHTPRNYTPLLSSVLTETLVLEFRAVQSYGLQVLYEDLVVIDGNPFHTGYFNIQAAPVLFY